MAQISSPGRTYGYLRQSLDAAGDRFAVTRQREAIEKAIPPGVQVAEWFTDNDASATRRKPRPEFERLLAVLQPGDAVWIVRLDRLARRPIDLERMIERAESVAIRSLGGAVRLDTAEGRATARVLVAMSAMEAEAKGERQRLANAQRAARGEAMWQRTTPFGYRKDGRVHDKAAAALRETLEAVCAGTSLAEACRRLNAAGWRTGTGKAWSYGTLRKHLLNPRYAGWRAHNGALHRAAWEPLWSDADAARVATLLAATERRKSLSTRPKHLLSSIARCAVCGAGVHAANPPGQAGIYRCPAGHVQRNREMCDAYAESHVRARLAAVGHPLTDRVDDEARRAVAAEREELTARREALARMLSRGLLPADAVEAQAEELTARLAELDRAPLTQPGPRTFGTYARGIEAWDALDLPHKRALLRQMGARITLVRIGRAFKATPEQPGLTIEWA